MYSYITSERLGVLLGFREATFSEWPANVLPEKRSGMMRCEDVDLWLAGLTRQGIDHPPTVKDLVSGKCAFTRISDAAKILAEGAGIRDGAVYIRTRVRKGILPAIRMPTGRWTVLKEGIERLLRERQEETQDFSLRDIERIFGVKPRDFGRLLAGRLETYGDPRRRGNCKLVTRESTIRLLTELLHPAWKGTADVWISRRLQSRDPFLVTTQVANALCVSPDKVLRLLKSGRFASILTQGEGRFLIEPVSFELYRQSLPKLTLEQKARIFGASVEQVLDWEERGLLVCPIHNHEGSERFPWCMAAYMEGRLYPGITGVEWVRYALHAGAVWGQRQTLESSSITWPELESAAQVGRIAAARNPDEKLVVTEKTVREEVRRLRA